MKHRYNGKLFNKKEQTTDIATSQKHYAKWKKQDTKGYIYGLIPFISHGKGKTIGKN